MPYVDPIPELKAQAARELVKLLEGWNSQFVAAEIGTDAPRISDIRRGKLQRFSLETLIRYITRLKMRVELRVVEPPFPRKPRPTKP
jgi:predicted XRE-type DNA-binding protein